MKTETNRSTGLREQIEALRHMTVGQLKDKYRDVFGESSRSNHKQFLFRRDRLAHAGERVGRPLGTRAPPRTGDRQRRRPPNPRAEELPEGGAGRDAARIETRVAPTEDPRLPMPGTELVRRYRGKDIVVRVREDGFEYDGQIHRSLSSAVREATGTPWNGFAFFGLGGKPGRKHGSHE